MRMLIIGSFNKPRPFKGLNTRIPIIIPITGRGFINHASTVAFLLDPCSR